MNNLIKAPTILNWRTNTFKILVCSIYLFVITPTWANDGKSASLKEIYGKTVAAQNDYYRVARKMDDSLAFHRELLLASIDKLKTPSDDEKMMYFKTLLWKYDYEKEIDSIYQLVERIKQEKLDYPYRVELNRSLAVVFDHNHNSAKALDLFFQGLEVALEHKDDRRLSLFAEHVAFIIYNRFPYTNQWQERKKELREQLAALYGLDSLFDVSVEYDYDTPEAIIQMAYPKECPSFREFEAHLLFTQGKLSEIAKQDIRSAEDLEKIRTTYGEILAYFNDKDKDHTLYYNVLHSYIVFLVNNQEFELAATYADKLNEILPPDIGYDFFDYYSFYENAALAHKKIGDYNMGLLYTELKNNHNYKRAHNIQKAYDFLLQKINGVNQARVEMQRINDKKRSNIVIGCTLLVIVLILIILRQSVTNGKKLMKSRNRAFSILREKELLEGEIEILESTISRDLHDNFGNKITGILHSYEIMKEINQEERLNSQLFAKFNRNFERSLSALLMDIKDLVWINDPQNNSLNRLLFRLEENATNKIGIKVISEFENDLTLPKFWNRQLFLIFKEAIDNAAKHSGTTCMMLKIYSEANNKLVVEAIDKGCGFDVSEKPRLPGLDSMQRRADAISGKLQIMSSTDWGTTVKFTSQEFSLLDAEILSKPRMAM